MNVDFRLLRRSALAVCGAALLGFTAEGCVSTHKPRFWDQDDVKGTTDTSGSPSTTTPPPAADAAATKPASTVVAADHTSADDPTGHSSALNFADSTPSPPGSPNAIVADSQPVPQSKSTASGDAFAPTAPQNAGADVWGDKPPAAPSAKKVDASPKASDPFAESAALPPAAPAPPTVNVSTTPMTAAPSKGTSSVDPFAEAENPVFAGKDQTRLADMPARQAMPAPPEGASSVQSPSASPDPIASSQPAPIVEAASALPVAPAPPQPAPTVAAAEIHKNTADPFADPNAAPAMRSAAVHAAEDKPSCAAPAPSQNYATGVATPETSAQSPVGNPATSAALVPTRAPASTEQVTDLVVPASDPQVSQMVIPAVKSAAPRVDSKPSVAKASAHAAQQPTSDEPQWTHAALREADATVTDSMILDSNSVRGRFTGTDRATGSPAHLSPVEETPHKRVPQPIPQPAASPVQQGSSPQPIAAPQTEPLSRSEADDPFATASTELSDAGQTAHEPTAKSLSGVVNAIAQQDSPSPAADPFALEQTVDTSVADQIHVKTAHASARADAPQAFDPFDAPNTLSSSEVSVADSSVTPTIGHFAGRFHSETWFAFGLAAGLIASLIMWLRSRPKNNHAVNG